jgi:hypothetical protein
MSEERHPRDFERLESPLDAAVQATLAGPLPQDAIERVKARAAQLAATHISPSRIADPRRRGWRVPRSIATSLAVAAALLAMVTGFVLFLDYSGGRAFAQMIEKVKSAGSVQFTVTTRFGQNPQRDGRMYLEGNRMRFELVDSALVQVADLERQRSLILNTVDKEFQQVEISSDA